MRQQPSHMLHFVATILTCSLWLVPWALVALAPRRWRCQVCGGKHMAGFKQWSFVEWGLAALLAVLFLSGVALILAAVADHLSRLAR